MKKALVGVTLLLVVGITVALTSGFSQTPTGTGSTELLTIDTAYPAEWRVADIAAAQPTVAFPLVLPNDPSANQQNIAAIYVRPDRLAVYIEFPAPTAPQIPVRQDYIEVFESPWRGGDPAQDYATDIAAEPVVGKQLYDVSGVPALGVSAHSPSDQEQANPAFLRFVHRGIEYQISGGESVDLLIEIAKTIVASSP